MKVDLEDIFEVITLRNDMNLFSIIINKSDMIVSDGLISKHNSVSSRRKVLKDDTRDIIKNKTMIVVKNAKYVILYDDTTRKMSLIISKEDLNNIDVISNVVFETNDIKRKWKFRDMRKGDENID